LLDRFADTEDPQELAAAATSRAVAATSEADVTAAGSHAERALSYAEALGQGSATLWAWPIAADAALAVGDLAEANRLCTWLDEHPLGHIPPVLRAERLRIRARLAAAHGDSDVGVAFDAATQAFRNLGSPYHLAVYLLDQADYLSATGNPPTAEQLAAEAEEIAHGLGARPLLERTGLLLARHTPAQLEPDAVAR
jgi:hypothetical protein